MWIKKIYSVWKIEKGIMFIYSVWCDMLGLKWKSFIYVYMYIWIDLDNEDWINVLCMLEEF